VNSLQHVDALCEITNPFASGPEIDSLFVAAMREIIGWHRKNSAFYAGLLSARSFDPDSLHNLQDLAKIPLIPADFFKTHELLSVPQETVAASFTSSGTSGQKSQMFFDKRSLAAGQRMVDDFFAYYSWQTPQQPTNYLLYSYETEPESKVGTAYTDNFLCKYAPVNEAFAAIRLTATQGGQHEFDLFGCLRQLETYQAEGLPVRIFGFPAFLYQTLKRMRDLNLPKFQLAKDSLVILGGGWKGQAGSAVSKEQLYELTQEQLGIPTDRIRDSFGAVEHGVPYMECSHHSFHVPVWSKVFIRDVRTFAALPFGQPGFLQFLTPFNTAVPAHSLMMGDLAILHPGEKCGCGLSAPYFEILGRAGTSKNRSCALAAAELLGKTS